MKKLGRIPAGGGHRVHGRAAGMVNRRADRSGGGGDDLHAAVDDHSRLAYVEVLGDERAQTCARFWRRAHRWFAVHGITVTSVLTDNGVGYRSRLFGTALADGGVRHRRTRPYRPQTNGKVERFNRTCWRSGPIGGCIAPTPPAIAPCSPGSIGTTITELTPLSVAGHPSAASTTSPVTTPRTSSVTLTRRARSGRSDVGSISLSACCLNRRLAVAAGFGAAPVCGRGARRESVSVAGP